MNNELYATVVTHRDKSPDGETPTRLVVTEENNGFICWLESFNGTRPLAWGYFSSHVINFAADRRHLSEDALAKVIFQRISSSPAIVPDA